MQKAHCLSWSIGALAGLLAATASAAPALHANVPPPESVCAHCAQPYAEIPLVPPKGFDAVTASDAQLDLYGFPPRPDAKSEPDAYAAWKALMSRSTKRIVPQLQATTITNGPARIVSQTQTAIAASPHSATSNNWSGYVLTSAKNVFATARTRVFGTFTVPTAQQAFGTCSSTFQYSFVWVGIDGWASGDVLQGGIEADAQCAIPSEETTPFYSAWYEWFPNTATRITNLPISPGDVVQMYVWNVSSTVGNFFIADLTKNSSTTIRFHAPGSVKLKGDSAEWIMERPGVNGTLSTLMNYVANPWFGAYVHVPGKAQYSPTVPQDAKSLSVTMLDDNNLPISKSFTSGAGAAGGPTYIDPTNKVTRLPGTALWFFDEGSALGTGQ